MKDHIRGIKTTRYRQHIVVHGIGNGFMIESNEHMTDSDTKAEILAQVSQVLDEAFANPTRKGFAQPFILEAIGTEWDEEQQKYVEHR
jgi:hypothetical protein